MGGTAETLFTEASVSNSISADEARVLKDRDNWNKSTSPQTAVETAEQLFRKQPALVYFRYHLRAVRSYGTSLVRKLLNVLDRLIWVAIGAVAILLAKEQWPSMKQLWGTLF